MKVTPQRLWPTRGVTASEVRTLRARIRELERLLGRKTMEAEILKEAIEIAPGKNCYCESPCPRRTISYKATTDTLTVSRANQYEQKEKGPSPRKRRYTRAEHKYYLPLIRKIADGMAGPPMVIDSDGSAQSVPAGPWPTQVES
jgi:hypothetical protein